MEAVGHVLAHGVIQHTANLAPTGQTGALREAIAAAVPEPDQPEGVLDLMAALNAFRARESREDGTHADVHELAKAKKSAKKPPAKRAAAKKAPRKSPRAS
ncbi:hypothetical protein Spa2297_34365 (plasmid) [Streptomyces parvulus]|uniref:Ku domain-containing protein n=1 Tax=Streptomyces parvulus TaxID=146923 RepID=A0A191VB62_9ACTN|nr:hypothetical protein [Streptomyces parvulus]ANJ12150.1 hypothetical protein Spa2297_34365 [Streptomyces parvulus]